MQNSGWNASENLTPFKNLSEEETITIINSALFGNSKHTTSYKYVFFKSILDNLFNVHLNATEHFLSFDAISLRFTEIYWNLILKYGLKQITENKNSAIKTILFNFCEKNKYSTNQIGFPFENLTVNQQLELTKIVKKAIVTKDVLGAFCRDMQWQFYHYSKTKKWDGIYINHDFFIVLGKYRSDFEKVNYYQFLKFLESKNREEDTYKLATKLDESTKREKLDIFRKALFEFGQTFCFYCGKKLVKNEVDHFIPWSFVKDDKLWNFVLSCPSCNSKKSDKLTSQKFLTHIRIRNEKLANNKNPFVQNEFKTYTFSKLTLMYNNAVFNGFKYGWEPN